MRRVLSFLGIFSLSFLLPNVVFAEGWVERKVGDTIAYVLKLIFEPIFDSMVAALSTMMSTPDLSSIPYVEQAMEYSRIIAGSLLVTTLAFRLWRAQGRLITGQQEPIADILYKTAISAVLIYGLPEILSFLLQMNALLIEGIKTMGVDLTKGLKTLAFPLTQGITLSIFFCIWIVALCGLSISNAIRLAELCFLYVVGPIMAVSHAGKGESFQIWVMQAVSVTFTQAVQFFLVGFALNNSANMALNSWTSLLLPIGSVVLAIRGPQVLKQFLYSSGVTGVAVGYSQAAFSQAIYGAMLKR
ncbi:conjugal transfer protein TrbL family protein [Bacillus sp. FSL K6-6540]|uniref:conjugal transfer protein TrbL family protein n=1 Tax=Bacillus sp. FSL K6-6540 TaxID=2921512 RepID=UPI0030F796F2